MKKIIFLLPVMLFTAMAGMQAQVSTKTLKKVLELKINREFGSNAASVAWHPGKKKYYAAMAGNVDFPLDVFDEKGKQVSADDQKTLFDIRGMWYNANTKTIQMNGYSDNGFAEYTINTKDIPVSVSNLNLKITPPYIQSVAAFDAKSGQIYFYNEDGKIEVYNYKDGGYVTTLQLSLGLSKKDVDNEGFEAEDNYYVAEDYNNTTVVFTGIAKAEFGLLNYYEKRVELYNKADGHMTQILKLPDDAPAPDFLNFSYCNGIFWLFDKENRIWMGYK
jgi:hypothetical protein